MNVTAVSTLNDALAVLFSDFLNAAEQRLKFQVKISIIIVIGKEVTPQYSPDQSPKLSGALLSVWIRCKKLTTESQHLGHLTEYNDF